MVRLVGKWILSLLAVLIVLIIAGTVIVALKRTEIQQYIVDELNNNINARAEIKQMQVRFLKNFPWISATFYDVTVIPYHTDKLPVRDTLLQVARVGFEFNPWLILTKKKFKIREIEISQGKLSLFRSADNAVNWKIWGPSGTQSGSTTQIEVGNLSLTNLEVNYRDFQSKQSLRGDLDRLRWTGGGWTGTNERVRANLVVESWAHNGQEKIGRPFEAGITVFTKADNEEKDKSFKGKLTLDKNAFDLNGSILPEGEANLRFEGKNLDPEQLLELVFPEGNNKIWRIKGLDKLSLQGSLRAGLSGPFSLDGEILGKITQLEVLPFPGKEIITEVTVPSVLWTFATENGNIVSKIKADDVVISYANSVLSGALVWNNPGKAYSVITATLQPGIRIADIPANSAIDGYLFQEGIINGSLKVDIPVKRHLHKLAPDKEKFRITGSMALSGITGGKGNSWLFAKDLSGLVEFIDDQAHFNLNGQWLGTSTVIQGNLNNWMSLIDHNGNPVLEADVKLSGFRLDNFLARIRSSNSEKHVGEKQAGPLPEIHLAVETDTFFYRDFAASDVRARVTGKKGTIVIDPMSFVALDGKATGLVEWTYSGNGSAEVKAFTDLESINISKLFQAFDDFGQTFITSENLGGELSGNVAFQAQTDTSGRIRPETILSNASLTLDNGALKEARFLYSLSTFIRLSELKNIRFSRLENELFIQNGEVIIPSMQIYSSALDLDIFGTHNFSSAFRYNIHLSLSDLLFGKAKAEKRENSQYGILEEEKDGRTGLYLVYEGDKNSSRVIYDKTRARAARKEEWKREGDLLKNILNQEFGLFKNDTTLKKGDVGKSKRFKVLFSDEKQGQQKDTVKQKKPAYKISWDDEPVDTSRKK